MRFHETTCGKHVTTVTKENGGGGSDRFQGQEYWRIKNDLGGWIESVSYRGWNNLGWLLGWHVEHLDYLRRH